MLDQLKTHFNSLDLPEAAVEWLCDLWLMAQLFDDVADGDEIERTDLDAAIWASMVKMPTNSFYTTHGAWLIPAVAQMTLEWMASDLAEREGRASEQSYMWRAGYYRVVCLVCSIVHGPSSEISERALSMYGETFEEYKAEFPNA